MRIVVICLSLLLSIPNTFSQDFNLNDLKDDDTRWNAINLLDKFWSTNNVPISALTKGLDSEDYQQRQFSASILMDHLTNNPPLRLLEVAVEGLRDDQYPYDSNACVFVFNAAAGMRFLMVHGKPVKNLLLDGVKSKDPQKQFLCAFLLGHLGITEDIQLTAPLLIKHLRDNDIFQDACMSCTALYRMGKDVIPYLKQALPKADKQQRDLILLIINDLNNPPKTKKELHERKKRQNISDIVYDPAIEYEVFTFSSSFGN